MSVGLWIGWLLLLAATDPRPAGDPEAAALAAEAAGQQDEAFQQYVLALRALPDPPPTAADLRLRERILKIVLETGTSLPVPPEAQAALEKGQSLVDAHHALAGAGDTGGLQAADASFRQAIRLAPWWPEPIMAHAGVLQELKQYDEAAGNLRLFRLAHPDGKTVPSPTSAPTSAPATATVYVYWPRQFAGGGNPNRIECNGKVIAKLQRGRFVVLTLAPGVYKLDFGAQVSSDFQGGHEYYVRASYSGFPKHKALRLASKDEATREMKKDDMTLGDPDHIFDTQCASGRQSGSLSPRRH